MADIIARHRPLALLAGLIFVQLMLLAFQVKREHNVTLVRYWAVQAFTPVERAGKRAACGAVISACATPAPRISA